MKEEEEQENEVQITQGKVIVEAVIQIGHFLAAQFELVSQLFSPQIVYFGQLKYYSYHWNPSMLFLFA